PLYLQMFDVTNNAYLIGSFQCSANTGTSSAVFAINPGSLSYQLRFVYSIPLNDIIALVETNNNTVIQAFTNFSQFNTWTYAIDEISILPRTIPTATSSSLGIVEPDNSTITISSGIISVPTATTSKLGIVRPDNSTVTISGGVISVPTATTSSLGIVEPDNSTVTVSNGIVSAINIINYITNWNFEGNSIIGWTTYANIAQSTPTDGITGYSNITFAINNITP